MKMNQSYLRSVALAIVVAGAFSALAQNPDRSRPRDGAPPIEGGFPPSEGGPGFDGPPPFGPGGFGPGPGGPGGMQPETKLVKQFDQDGDHYLNSVERKAAREFLAKERSSGRGRRGPGGPGFPGRGETQETAQPGPKLSPAEAKSFPDAPLYDPLTLRTLFLEFEDADWEGELADFKNTDVEVPAKLTVDGKVYPDVGVHFRGMSSFMMVSEGRKRSLNLSLDFIHKDQKLGGHQTLNLLNSHEDPTFLRSVLYYEIARKYIPAPKANFVRVVINGESWGVYANAEQFNKDFVKEWFDTTKGARWKVPGSPGGRGSLAYLGDDVAPYKAIYEIKSKDDPKSWADLVKLCRVLNETPSEQLERALEPLLDIDGALKFLALENALINNDGYWIRTSDYNIYEDQNGRFHIIPHDANETFLMPGGPPGGRGGPGGFGPGRRAGGGPGNPAFGGATRVNGVELDPLVAANDPNKPLISKLLAVPALRTRYLGYVRDIAENWLDWNKLGPLAERYHQLIADEVKKDTRKLSSTEAFLKGVTEDVREERSPGGLGGPGGGRQTISLKSFAEKRRAYLLNDSELKRTGT